MTSVPVAQRERAHRKHGVYVAAGETRLAKPLRVAPSGEPLKRFIDSIYLDRPCERLSKRQIKIVNEARRPLMGQSDISEINTKVRRAMAAAVNATSPLRVLEWGCGYHSMESLIHDARFSCLDIDPIVVQWQREHSKWHAGRGRKTVYLADTELERIESANYDVIISAFVFHFWVSRLHISTMKRALKDDGYILANVYRRGPLSRKKLVAEFERAGFMVEISQDPVPLCASQEFWCLTLASDDRGRARQILNNVTDHLLKHCDTSYMQRSTRGEQQTDSGFRRSFRLFGR